MFKFHISILKLPGSNGWMPLTRINAFLSSVVTEPKSNVVISEDENHIEKITNPKRNNLVSVAFASLRTEQALSAISTPFTDQKIKKSQTVDDLLSISVGSGTSRRHALKVVSVLAEWTTTGKVKLSDFESDKRFLKLCKILSRGNSQLDKPSNSENLSTILSVTADDEAAKMVETITLPQMVKVMSTLSMKRRRPSLLLRALAYNMTSSPQALNIKECSDLLFAMSTLHFIDENLLAKIAGDAVAALQHGILKTSSVVGSMLTSLGHLRYKNIDLLEAITNWVEKNYNVCRPQDIFALVMTMGILKFVPSNSDKLFRIVEPQLTQSEAGKPIVWLEIVWSLVLLNRASSEQIASVLRSDFINSIIEDNSFKISHRLKLLNIDGAARHLQENYSGPQLLPEFNLDDVRIELSKEKSVMVGSVIETLKNLVSDAYLQTRVNTGLGFYIDAVCVLDKKCIPQPVNEPNINPEYSRIAIMVYDYHDMCVGRIEPTGISALAESILKANGYKVLAVPYTEFKPRDKIVYRVQYLEGKLKEIASGSS
ncbi:uncharacterized protein LOC132700689 [Cylas formicarius]|uniref:uncharacterized protein LOC132700689 n=1 Tax=Cylas formicarius TaxID=197179 RepID=UPI00295851F1|nr:uncharacterized protein LOC132700689 [Cylas formicarius]